MKVPPLVLGMAVLFASVTAMAVVLVAQNRRGRSPPPRSPEQLPEDPRPAPRPLRALPTARLRAPPARPVPAPNAELRLRVTGPHGFVLREACAWATPRGEPDASDLEFAQNDDDPDGTLSLHDLEAGWYDVDVVAPGMRTAHIPMRAGQETAAVSLSREPVLLGAIGGQMQMNEPCDEIELMVRGAPTESDEHGAVQFAQVDPETCTFMVTDLPEHGPLTVAATNGDQTLRALVTLPETGDPAFLCLRPPCAEPLAVLVLYLADADGRLVEDDAIDGLRINTEASAQAMPMMIGGALYVADLPVGSTTTLEICVSGTTVQTTAVLGPGMNEAVLTFPGAAAVAGAPSGSAPTHRRCAWRLPSGTRGAGRLLERN